MQVEASRTYMAVLMGTPEWSLTFIAHLTIDQRQYSHSSRKLHKNWAYRRGLGVT